VTGFPASQRPMIALLALSMLLGLQLGKWSHLGAQRGSPALATLTSSAGDLQVEVRTAPGQPPSVGLSTVTLNITDAAGTPQNGLSLAVVPWMPAMGHGTSVTPVVAATGKGTYRIYNVSLFMAGQWELRVDVRGTTTDQLVIPLLVS